MTQYNTLFYDAIREGCQRSAAAALPLLDLPSEIEVVDVGGGEGWWGRWFLDRGSIVEVWDGADADDGYAEDFYLRREVDLRDPLPEGDFDLALCLEVAEHLPPERGSSFVADLCRLAPRVVFSAAMPRQGGTGHINCQPPAYWASLFRDHGFGWRDPRMDLWNHPDIEPWYKSNLLVFETSMPRQDELPRHIQHPDLYLEPRR